jgi:hypothetical protein
METTCALLVCGHVGGVVGVVEGLGAPGEDFNAIIA